ncbi:MAG: glycosyltransferase [Verrucomicrobiota bacterium]|nr:glycosyltransferase [Verrucomicrobiota bacterium]
MKICDLTQFYSPVSGGVKRYVQEKVHYIQEHTNDEHILIVPGERDEVVRGKSSRVYAIRSPLVSKTSRYRMLLRLNAIERILEDEMPDVIESGDPYQVAWKAIASGAALGVPVVGFYHSHFPEAYFRSAAKFFGKTATEAVMRAARHYVCNLYNRFERTLVPSPALGKLLGEWGVENVANVDLGVNTQIFRLGREQNVREELEIPADRTLLLYVGRLASEKNTRTLFSAFELLAEDLRFHLLAVGDGPQRSIVEKLQRETGAVTWLPYCANSERLADLYTAADIFVHPGVQETFGLVALESQACGTPVVGIRGSYLDRIIFSNQQHWAAENTPAALAGAIRKLPAHLTPESRARLSQKVAQRYSWRQVFDRLFEIYRDVAPHSSR